MHIFFLVAIEALRWGFSKCSFWIICISITRKACENLMRGS